MLKNFFIPLVFQEGNSFPEGFTRASKFRGRPMVNAGLEI